MHQKNPEMYKQTSKKDVPGKENKKTLLLDPGPLQYIVVFSQ